MFFQTTHLVHRHVCKKEHEVEQEEEQQEEQQEQEQVQLEDNILEPPQQGRILVPQHHFLYPTYGK